MKILFLGYEDSPLIDFIQEEDTVSATSQRVATPDVIAWAPDFIVSYGYKYILKAPLLEHYPDRVINLHISYLPWNRGYHPNFWSFLDNTPRGVSIHFIDEGIDTGDLLAQKEVTFGPEEDTLEKTYGRLRVEMENLFRESWPAIRSQAIAPTKQDESVGSFHYKRDLEKYWPLLEKGWATPIHQIEGLRGTHS